MAEAGLPVALALVDRPCRAADVATGHRIPLATVARTSFGDDFDRDAYTDRVVADLDAADIGLVAMAGFGTILGPALFAAFGDRVVNTHPSLLPAFPGWHAVREALAAGVKVTGCTVHVAVAEVDAGPILAQQAVPVLPGDDEATLHERIKAVERRLYPATIAALIENLDTV